MESKFEISLSIVLVEDKNIGGYTSFFKQFPDIISEGNSEKEAIKNLMDTFKDVLNFQSKSGIDNINSKYSIIERPANLCFNE
jgi:predicted RNase H-like HicB family nuclease